jgi:hypothetical protein
LHDDVIDFFENKKTYPSTKIILGAGEIINDVSLFVKTHLRIAKQKNKSSNPYFKRLLILKNII